MKKITPFIIILLCIIATSNVIAYYETEAGEPVIITTTCINDNVLGSDNATISITSHNNTITLPTTNMTYISTGIYKINVTFINSGTYTTIETCNFNGTIGIGSDQILVKNMITPLLIIILLSYFAAWAFLTRPGYTTFGAFSYIAISLVLIVQYKGQYSDLVLYLPMLFSIIYTIYVINDELSSNEPSWQRYNPWK